MAIFTDIIDSDHPTTSTLYDLVTYNTSTKVISITTGTSIPANAAYNSDEGVTLQALYSHAKYAWKYDNDLIKHSFPFIAITAEQYEVVNGWTIDADTIQILRTGGFAVVDENGVLQEEWINVITLGNLNSNEQVYYTFDAALVPSSTINFNQVGTINECIKIFENGVQAKENYLGLFVRTYGRTFDSSNTTDIGVTSGFDTQVYRFPLSTLDDVKLAGIDGSAITGVTFTEGSVTKDIDANTGLTFDRVISANSVSLQNIYARTQYLLTLDSPIYGTTSGKTAPAMLVFLGDNVITEAGVFVETLTPAEKTRITFTAADGNTYQYDFTAGGNIIFNSYLSADSFAVYKVFYGTLPATEEAPLTFTVGDGTTVNGQTSIPFEFKFNELTNPQVTAVAIGLDTAQYVTATVTLENTTSNTISLVSALERNYSN